MPSLYDELGVTKDASADDLKRAYRAKASQHHPDRGGDPGRMSAVTQAYRVLSDDAQRSLYDATGMMDVDEVKLAKELLTGIFGAVLDGDVEFDVVEAVKDNIDLNLQKIHESELAVEAKLAKLESRKKVLWAKSGLDLYELLVSARREVLHREQATLALHKRVHEKALVLLEDYESLTWAAPAYGTVMGSDWSYMR